MKKLQFHPIDQSAPRVNINDLIIKLGHLTGEYLI